MEVFIPRICPPIQNGALRDKVRDILTKPECWLSASSNNSNGSNGTMTCNDRIIREFDIRLWKNKGDRTGMSQQGKIIIHDRNVALNFLQYLISQPMYILDQQVRCVPSRNNPATFQVAALKAANDRAIEQANKIAISKRREKSICDFRDFQCGAWKSTAANADPTFIAYYRNLSDDGEIRFYAESVILNFKNTDRTEVIFERNSIRSIVVDAGYRSHAVTFTLAHPPRMHKAKLDPKARSEDYYRVSAIDDEHAEVAPYCFAYRLTSSAGYKGINMIHEVAKRYHLPKVERIPTLFEHVTQGPLMFRREREWLQNDISKFDFKVAFQLEALYINGCMLPSTVQELLPVVKSLVTEIGSKGTASVLRDIMTSTPGQDPLDDVGDWTLEALEAWIREKAEEKKWALQGEQRATIRYSTQSNLVEVHRVSITPAGRYLNGPTLEPKNRVLRLYDKHLDNFLRVDLIEEDGTDLFLADGANSSGHLFETRLKKIFEPFPTLMRFSDKHFSFLGFSQSSLRAHQCWFMASIHDRGEDVSVEKLIANMGDFSNIRIPGKCAARIGQAFTDTIACMEIPREMETRIGDVLGPPDSEGKRRTFSDGVGTISLGLLRKIWRKRGDDEDEYPPTVYQIRFGGAKGVVALDTRVPGNMLSIRNSMVKFHAPKHRQFEICTSAKEPLAMYMNRPLVKILEDLDVPSNAFMALQRKAIEFLKQVQKSSLSASHFLSSQNIATIVGLPFLFQALEEYMGASFQEEAFLRQILYYSLLIQLRDMKYRTRIPVEKGVTLIGILDETGFLEEGQVYCVMETASFPRKVLEGPVCITKSPVHHPGDVRLVTAVEVPEHSPLRSLRNCVCFSQKGQRDLPSMLSGGDLDGDLYNIIYDESLLPLKQHPPAEYPKVEAVALPRPVIQADIGEFFIKFMLNDRLGLISITQQIIADQKEEGIFHPDCLKLAELASTAVDFPKTGVEVKPTDIPKAKRERPDFMAPGPRTVIDRDKVFDEESRLSDVSDSDDGVGADAQRKAIQRRRQGRDKRTLYYRSEKVTGKLYRDIDERAFIRSMSRETDQYFDNKLHGANDAGTLLEKVKDWVIENVEDNTFQESKSARFAEFAADLKVSYESRVLDLIHTYSESRNSQLTEAEVFGGFILGKENSKLSRRQREDSKSLRDETSEVLRGIVGALRQRDEPEPGEDDTREYRRTRNKALQKCIACLKLAVGEETGWTEQKKKDRGKRGWNRPPLKGFGWIAASIALREIKRREEWEVMDRYFGGVRI